MNITLSEIPPPLSACFKNARRNGRIKTDRYKKWINLMGWQINLQRGQFQTYMIPVQVVYTIKRPDKRKRDLDNLLKALNDLLSSQRIIEDDSLIHDLRIKWSTSKQKEAVVIDIDLV